MPLDDWTKVPDSVFHSFHNGWLWNLMGSLNRGVLPEGYLARTEESLRIFETDPLVLESGVGPGAGLATSRKTAPSRQRTLTLAPEARGARNSPTSC